MDQPFSIKGNLVDVHKKKIYPAEIIVEGERITSINPLEPNTELEHYILPGFIDSHVHIESSMLIPSEFAKLAVIHGTVSTVSDPHEIANVSGMEGVDFMIENGKTVPFKFNFGAPSCVPATIFETAGATIDAKDIEDLMRREEILYLSEMMNFPGVLNNDPEVVSKIEAAKKNQKPVDGHAPGLRGEEAKKYINAGISTDHECFTKEEALDKLKYGMKILIREGSAAKNFEALIDLLHDYEDSIMFCSDDKHPDSLVEGHINQLCARAVAKGIDIFKVVKAASVNPVQHYKLKVGLLKQSDFADFVLVRDLESFDVVQTFINGQLIAEEGKNLFEKKNPPSTLPNNFSCSPKAPEDFIYSPEEIPLENDCIQVIEALDGQLITNKLTIAPKVVDGKYVSDIDGDVLKIVVVNRYNDAPIAKAFIKNFCLKKGAIASSVAHDSHNIVAVGVDDESLAKAVNQVIEHQGGISLVDGEHIASLALPVAGLMSNEPGLKVAEQYGYMDKYVKEQMGSTLTSPFMTLSFMALLVIPHLKLSDKGLFDGTKFDFVK